ncbi:hypothetical protein B7494_g905 [Chlorociboria aeruginascens]|nr:hypothetical protein B7494_g905 [Chlorociboria aeruginascens]
MPYLPYEEPDITVILSLTSFIILLNAARYVLDRLLYCGLIGEILIGIIWGMPVGETAWLSTGTQETIQQLGYLGLIGLVFEGGLNTDFSMLRKFAYLSISIATVGLLMPIALSFLLLVLPIDGSEPVFPTPLGAFSAGASLCSTSLGMTFAILSSAKMQQTKIGAILVGAAMMDDVVGLVMVKIVTTIGGGGSGGWSIARPIVSSFGMLLVTLCLAPYVLRPIWTWLIVYFQPENRPTSSTSNLKSLLQLQLTKIVTNVPHLNFVLSTAVLVVFITIASFIGTSLLFAAFIAGGIVSFLWSIYESVQQPEVTTIGMLSGIYDEYYKSVMEHVLVPFFFVSRLPISVRNPFRPSPLEAYCQPMSNEWDKCFAPSSLPSFQCTQINP